MTPVHRSVDQAYFMAPDGGRVLELLNPENSVLQTFSVARVCVEPGVRAKPHWHERTEEVYFILSGRAIAHLDDQVHELAAGDALCIPRGKIHYLENQATEPVDYLAISSPPYDDDDMHWQAAK